jgi:predicted nucleic acid-binding protein
VILYLQDENVIREMHSRGDAAVQARMASVDDSQLRLSAITFFELRETV